MRHKQGWDPELIDSKLSWTYASSFGGADGSTVQHSAFAWPVSFSFDWLSWNDVTIIIGKKCNMKLFSQTPSLLWNNEIVSCKNVNIHG